MSKLVDTSSRLRRLLAPERSDAARRQRGSNVFDWRGTMRRRLAVVVAGFVLWSAGIESKLVYLQVFQHDDMLVRAERQQQRTVDVHPKRGEILDRNGAVLAYSVDADTVYAVPSEVTDAAGTAAALCAAFDECPADLQAAITDRLSQSGPFAYVRRQVTPEEARRVAERRLQGVGFLKENRRYYPNKSLGAHLLGFVGIDNQGLSGIESTYDAEISGRPGKILVQTDARRRAFSRIERPPTAGATLELTIDKYLQHIVERELRIGIRAHGADAGAVVMLDPLTGEVLALASEPTFNPNVFRHASQPALRNRAVQDIYEPGSTFKVVTASAAFEEQVVEADEMFDVSAGAIRVGGDRIPDFHVYDQLSFTDVLVKSSNVGAILVGLRLGPERLSRYVRRFGFGEALSPDLPAESPGIVTRPSKLTERALASLSMGYQVAVTPLQMAAAVAAIANGGELLEPRVVRAVRQNGRRAESERRVIRRAITRDTAAQLTTIMEQVAQRGTARRAQVPGYTVAGKTGTSEKLIDGRYSDTDHNASFVGFVPSRRPRLAILVMVDTPRSAMVNGVRQRVYTGGAVAAPIFQRIAEASLRHLAVPPTVNPHPAVLVDRGRRPRAIAVSTASPRPPTVARATAARAVGGSMPDLRGLSGREALEATAWLGLEVRVDGDGEVVRQDPAPGAAVERGDTTTLWLHRHPAALDRQVGQ